MKILVVEDEPKTGNYLKQGLAEAGFIVDLARDGEDGLHDALTVNYDLVILDVMLPGLDGWGVLRGIRASGKEIPVLFLTARDQVDDRVRGLELGADDYSLNRLLLPNCWHACAHCCAGAAKSKNRKSCVRWISNLI